jgi:hypothetical protein
MTLSTLEYPTETKVRIALQSKLLELNGPASYRKENKPTFSLVIDRFIESERLVEILAQPPGQVTITDGVAYSTASGYVFYLRKHLGTAGFPSRNDARLGGRGEWPDRSLQD